MLKRNSLDTPPARSNLFGLVLSAVGSSIFALMYCQPCQSLVNEHRCNEYRIADQIDKLEHLVIYPYFNISASRPFLSNGQASSSKMKGVKSSTLLQQSAIKFVKGGGRGEYPGKFNHGWCSTKSKSSGKLYLPRHHLPLRGI